MKRWTLLGLLALLLPGIWSAQPLLAQTDLQLETLRVGLWPEYDQPALLVIYWATLPETTNYPATVSLRIPANVDAPHVVAAQADPLSNLDEVEYENAPDGDWHIITFEVNGPRFQFEYYDSLAQEGDARALSYTWPGDYGVSQLRIELQNPPHSSGLTTDPVLPQADDQSNDGLIYSIGEFGPLDVGESVALQVNYRRSDDTLTADLLQTLAPLDDTASAGGTTSTTAPASDELTADDVLLVAAVALWSFLLGAFVMWLAMNRRQKKQ